MIERLKEFQLALMLLTRLPAGTISDPVPPTGQTAWAFPIVGFFVGAVMYAVFTTALFIGLPEITAALLALAAQALVTGGLHEDGLADTADGFGGGQNRERKLEIMRDSRIGSYGVLALILTLGTTATAIAEAEAFLAFVFIGMASRTAMLLPMAVLPPARDGGLGHGASVAFDKGVLAALCITIVVGIFAFGALLVTGLVAIALLALFKAQIGGQTGDTLGATQKLTECAGWLTLAAMAP